MKIFVIGAGQVGSTVVEALHGDHELTMIDLDRNRLTTLSNRYDIAAVEGNGASRRTLQQAGVEKADLLIACTSRDEVNIVAAMLAKKISPETRTIVRTTNVEFLELWQERQLDVDFMVSSELETANAVAQIIGFPAARQTDVFADGQVQMVEFDVAPDTNGRRAKDAPLSELAPQAATEDNVIGRPLREAAIPADSKVASIIRGGRMIIPRGNEAILPGDRVIIIGSPAAAQQWSRIVARSERRVRDVVVFGAGETGVAIARLLLEKGIRIRLLEANAERARHVAETLPEARVFHATGTDSEFMDREKIGHAEAAILAMPDDAKNVYAASLAKLHGVGYTIAIVHDPVSANVCERAGVDVAVNPRTVTAEEIVRWAHDPRVRQVAMLEGDRFEILDITVREESKLVRKPFKELPMTGSLIGAIVRNGTAIFPHGNDMLEPGDRAIIFTESSRAPEVERAL
jgi:trk system potassium uptake protein TrkA